MTTGQRDVARDLLSTLAEWHSTIRMWSGSAFVAGEDIGDDAGARKQLYLDLCRIGNETAWMEDEITRLRASQAGGVPAGGKLVPVEPTPEMLANADVGGWPGFDALRAFWGAMLPASPPPPATDGDALTTLRAAGWMVAVHNDYRLAGRRMTFWLLTHADGRWIKGEAGTDAEALSICCEAAALASSPPLAATDAVEAERALEPDELLPCPFCGSDAERVDIEGDEDGENFGGSCIQCTRCQASSAVVFGYKETLFSSWNERARGTDEVENG